MKCWGKPLLKDEIQNRITLCLWVENIFWIEARGGEAKMNSCDKNEYSWRTLGYFEDRPYPAGSLLSWYLHLKIDQIKREIGWTKMISEWYHTSTAFPLRSRPPEDAGLLAQLLLGEDLHCVVRVVLLVVGKLHNSITALPDHPLRQLGFCIDAIFC